MITLEEVYPWINKFEISHIRPTSDCLIVHIRKALSENCKDEARGLLQQLKDHACKLRDNEEVTDVLVECAYGFYILDDFAQAESILEDAVSRAWSDLQRRAVIQWMLGCVQWVSFPSRQQAVLSWRNSLSDFDRLARQPGLPVEQQAWYRKSGGQLEQSLLEALEQVGSYVDMDGSPASVDPVKGVSSQPVVTAMSSPLPGSTLTLASGAPGLFESAIARTSDILQLFTISEEIPAGDFGPSGIDPFPIGKVEVDRLSINGHPYSIHSTRGRKIINLPFDQKLTVIKVKGDSMDLENITMQDYIVIRKVEAPANGDIVMAEIVGIDSQATLKLFYKENDTITLKPHSSNPIHEPFIFKKVNEGFYIRGVVIAVLKPL
jgi:hypothetical protein